MTQINTKMPIMLMAYPNGGWIVEQSPPFTPPGTINSGISLGAFTTAEDLLFFLHEQLLEKPAEELHVVTEPVGTFDESWTSIIAAPRGVYVRIMDDTGARHRPMKFTSPCWWDAPNGELRLLDPSLIHLAPEDMRDMTQARAFKLLNGEENAKWNGDQSLSKFPVAAAPAPWAHR